MSTDGRSSLFVPSVHPSPTTDEIKQISDSLDLDCSPDLIKALTEHISNSERALDEFDGVDGFVPEVKYPRTSGRKPKAEENPGNAWAWFCDIKGASDGKLCGKKIAIKDNVAVAGVPMSNGSYALEGYTPEYDATVVTQILDAGGQIVGKAACDEFCCSSTGHSSTNGYIHKPDTPTYRAGGSSAGSAVLVSTGDVDMATGGDQGGSIRIPAAWCGVVGFKPTFGLIPYTGIISIEPSVDHVGPITKTVADCALFLEVLAGSDGIDSRQHPDMLVPEYSKMLDFHGDLILGKVTEGFECCDTNVQDLVGSFLENVSTVKDISVIDVTIPLHNSAGPAMKFVGTQGACTNLQMGTTPQFIDGFQSTSLQKAVVQGIKYNGRLCSPAAKHWLIHGEYLRLRYGNYYYAKSRNIIIDLRRQIDKALEKCDVLVMPTVPFLPPKFVDETSDHTSHLLKYLQASRTANFNTRVFNLTGHPALSIPLSKTGDPFKSALMIVGRKFKEVKVLQVGQMLEKIVNCASISPALKEDALHRHK